MTYVVSMSYVCIYIYILQVIFCSRHINVNIEFLEHTYEEQAHVLEEA